MLPFFSLGYVLIIIIAGNSYGWSNGAGDMNEEYKPGCHTSVDSGTIGITASTLSPTTGQSITVTVSVTPGSLGPNRIVGVFLLRALQASDSQPNVDGWVIQSDPNGGLHNYVEKVMQASETTVVFVWTLRAPSTPGSYTLYARTHFGDQASAPVYIDYNNGIIFDVSVPTAGAPSIIHEPPQKILINTQILINATLVNSTSGTLSWKNSAMSTPVSLDMTNSSVRLGKGWIYLAVMPAQDVMTQISYNINATGSTGLSTTASYSLTILETLDTEGITDELQFAWVLSVIATVVVILGITVIVSLLFKKQLKSK